MDLADYNCSELSFGVVFSLGCTKLLFFEKRIGAEKICGDSVPLNLNKKKQYCMKCFNFPTELQRNLRARTQWLVF